MLALLKILMVACLWLIINACAAAQSSSLTLAGLLTRADVQVELGLAEEMRKSIDTYQSNLAEYRESGAWEKIAVADTQFWQEIKPKLSAEQVTRLVGLTLQVRGYAALLDEEIVTSLQLAPDPRPSIRKALRNQENWPRFCAAFETKLAAELSDEVKSQLEKVRGAPFNFSPPLPMQNPAAMASANSKGGMNILGPLAALAMQPEVQEDLRLSTVAIDQMEALVDNLSQVSVIALRDSDWRFEPDSLQPELQASWRALIESFEANRCQLETELKTLLGEEKFQRLVGLLWQREGYGALLVSRAAVTSLDLSDHQLTELIGQKSNFLQHHNISRLTLSSLPATDLEPLLTSEQREKIEHLKGALITFGESASEIVARASATYNRGLEASRKGDYEVSIKEYDEAVRLAPKNSVYINNRGMIRQRLGLLQEALDDHNKALELNPRYSAGRYQRFQVLLSLGEFDRAIADLRELVSLEPTARNHQLLAMTLAEALQPQAAAEAYALADGKLKAQLPSPVRSLSPPLIATQSAFAGARVSGWYPAWSPDGKQIVRGSNFHKKLEALEIVNLDSGEVRLLCENAKLASWSPVVGGPILSFVVLLPSKKFG